MTSLVHVFLFFFSPQLIVSTCAMQDSALYRNIIGDSFSVGKFEQNPFSYLWVENLASSMTTDVINCTFLCVGEPKCYSFNMAVSPDSNSLYLCELLATDKYRSKTKFHANATFHHYSPKTPCESNPCLCRNCTCVPDFELNTHHCECKQGKKTCSTIKSRNPHFTSGLYTIDPDGKGCVSPFKVFCDMADKNGVGVTVVSHDSESRTQVTGYELPGLYERNVSYTAVGMTSVAQLTRLTDVSAHCEQFLKYECKGSTLLRNGNMIGWWASRDGEKMKYWGGSHYSFPYKCACGLNGTCAAKSFGCNCDINDYVWREDSGLLTNKSHLPVIQLRFGDTGHSGEIGYHTLGKLKCWGME